MRIPGIGPRQADKRTAAVLEAQAQKWGSPLANHTLYARRPSILRGARAMWGGLDESGLLEPTLIALLNRRVASLIGCEF